MAAAEKKRLLEASGGSGDSYGAEEDDGPPPPYEEHAPPPPDPPPQQHGKGRPWWKPKRGDRKLQRYPSLDKVDEDMEEKKEKKRCTDYFGVRSYLHDFYDAHASFKDPEVYEDDDDFRYLLNPRLSRGRRCTSIWWKVFVWIGANFLIFGIIGVLIGYLVPPRPMFAVYNEQYDVLDNKAVAFNFNLDVCKLVGLILFCIGGLTLAAALLFPSFLYHYCEDDRERKEESIRIHVGDEKVKSPVEMAVPTSSMVTEVQPSRKNLESVVTREGMVPMDD
jgi:hypothetical protein